MRLFFLAFFAFAVPWSVSAADDDVREREARHLLVEAYKAGAPCRQLVSAALDDPTHDALAQACRKRLDAIEVLEDRVLDAYGDTQAAYDLAMRGTQADHYRLYLRLSGAVGQLWRPRERDVTPPAPGRKPEDSVAPSPDEDFSVLLGAIEDLRARASSGKTAEATPARPDPRAREQAPGSAQQMTGRLTAGACDAIRAEIEQHWNVPAGVKDAGELVVRIRATFDLDGSLISATIEPDNRLHSDAFYRAAADSALRAVHIASPLQVPMRALELCRDTVLRFDARRRSESERFRSAQ